MPHQPENFSYTWNVTRNGAAFASNSSSTPTTVPNFTFTPDTSGTYVATLTVTDQSGFTTSTSNTFLVDKVTPIFSLVAPPTVIDGTANTDYRSHHGRYTIPPAARL